MPFAQITLCLIVELSDQEDTATDSHKFIDSLVLAGRPVFDSSVTIKIVYDVENAHEIRREFQKE